MRQNSGNDFLQDYGKLLGSFASLVKLILILITKSQEKVIIFDLLINFDK
jgi:hypothetical protein